MTKKSVPSISVNTWKSTQNSVHLFITWYSILTSVTSLCKFIKSSTLFLHIKTHIGSQQSGVDSNENLNNIWADWILTRHSTKISSWSFRAIPYMISNLRIQILVKYYPTVLYHYPRWRHGIGNESDKCYIVFWSFIPPSTVLNNMTHLCHRPSARFSTNPDFPTFL